MKQEPNLKSILFETLDDYFQQKKSITELKVISSLIKSSEISNKKELKWKTLSTQIESQPLAMHEE